MNTATARTASEGMDYLNVIKSFFKKNAGKNPKTHGDDRPVIVKILGLEFRHEWSSQLRAKYKTALGRVMHITIFDNDTIDNALIIDTSVSGREDVQDSSSIVHVLREDIAAIDAQTAASASVIAKHPTLKFGEVTISIKPVTGENRWGDWRFYYSGEFKLEVYGEKSAADVIRLSARKAGATKRVSVDIDRKIPVNKLQQKLDELIEANKLVLTAPDSAKTNGTVKIGDEVINVSVTSMKLFERHIESLQALYGKKDNK